MINKGNDTRDFFKLTSTALNRAGPCFKLQESFRSNTFDGEFHDQGDAKWIVIRRQLRGHNDTPCGRQAPGRPNGRLGSGRPQGVIDIF
jgi:hypothetical protein